MTTERSREYVLPRLSRPIPTPASALRRPRLTSRATKSTERSKGGWPTDGPVLIFEPNHTGHHLMYVKLLIKRADAMGLRVIVLTAEGVTQSEEYAVHLADVAIQFQTVQHSNTSLWELFRYCRRSDPQVLIVPDGDRFAMRLGLARWLPFASRGWPRTNVLIMRDPKDDPVIGARRKFLRYIKRGLLESAAGHPMITVLRLIPAGDERAARNAFLVRDPVEFTYDPDSVRDLRLRWGLRDDVFWFAILGSITSRKNVHLAINALLALGKPAGLLLAGKTSIDCMPSIASLAAMATVDISFVHVDRLLTDVEFDSALASIDCALLLHSNEGPSGVLGKVAASHTRVIAGGAGSLRADVQRSGLGVWVPLAVEDVADAMGSAMESPARLSAATHEVDDFDRLIVGGVRDSW